MSETTESKPARAGPANKSTPAVAALRWWGWGDRDGAIADGLHAELRDRLGIDGSIVNRPVALEDVAVEPSRLPPTAHAELSDALGGHVHLDRRQRVGHAAGKSYLDLLRQRSGQPLAVPDATVMPGSEADVAAVLAICERHSVAVVPFGGGTSVVGGVTPLMGAHVAVVSLDMSRLNRLLDVDPGSHLARFEAGMLGPAAEAALHKSGYTLGHFPQSFEYASIGGFAAARSAGQASGGYGRFDEMVVGLRCVTPRGVIVIGDQPPSATGPSLRQMVLGSEGILGVITEVTVRVRRAPAVQWYEGWSLPQFDSGVAALRRLVHAGVLPDVARLSDSEETRLTLAMAGGQAQLLKRVLGWRGQDAPCLVITGWDGSPESVTRRRGPAIAILREHGALRLGRRVGASWLKHRFASPYLRDPLLDRGVLVETLETATTWGRIHALRKQVVAALHDELHVDGHDPLVGAHVSHSYPEGGSLYVTVMARQGRDPIAQWQRAKARVNDIIVDNNAAISHHHGIGVDHAAWLERQIGIEGVAALRALKAQFDPAGILNPGKLIPGTT